MSVATPTGLRQVREDETGRDGRIVCHSYEVWDDQNRLAYVGIAENFEKRWEQHLRSSWWLGEIRIGYIVVIGYDSRLGARLSEAAMINEQAPLFNTAREAGAYREYLRLSEDPEWPGLGVMTFRRFVPANNDGFAS